MNRLNPAEVKSVLREVIITLDALLRLTLNEVTEDERDDITATRDLVMNLYDRIDDDNAN